MDSFHEVQFPPTISYGSRGGPGFLTNIVQGEGGNEQRIARWSAARRTYDAKWGIKGKDDLYDVHEFYMCRWGAFYGFRFKDWIDFTSSANGKSAPTATDQNIGSGDGSRTLFQLRKLYSSGSYQFLRNISKPVEDTVIVAVAGVTLTTGYSVDHTLGVVTIDTPPTLGQVVTAGFVFDVPVRFERAADESLQASLNDFDQGEIPSIPLVELMDGFAVPSIATSPGGSREICPTAPPTLTLDSRLWVIDTTHVSECHLADLAVVPPGGPVFIIVCVGPNDLSVKLFGSATVLVTLSEGDAAYIVCSKDFTGAKIWYAI